MSSPITPRYLSPVRLSEKDHDTKTDRQPVIPSGDRNGVKRQRSASPDSPNFHVGSPGDDAAAKRQRNEDGPSAPARSTDSRVPRSPSPPPRSPPRTLKRPKTTRPAESARRSPTPPPRSPPRQQKRPGAGSRIARPAARSPTPPPRSPPRQQKRPGAGSRTVIPAPSVSPPQHRSNHEPTDTRRPPPPASSSGAPQNDHQLVTQHYNEVRQYGVKWRAEQSNIRGLRSFNNWIKSCIINKFTHFPDHHDGLHILDIGCGKGGDLQKWRSVRPSIKTYVGLDPADVSIDNARDRFEEMINKNRGRRPFHATFGVKDCFGESIGGLEAVTRIGFDPNPDSRFRQGGFDVVSMMFCLHYAYESEEKARQMLSNVSSSLKKGGRFIGVIPNSDVIRAELSRGNKSWGNDIYNVEFRGDTPKDGVFRPPYGWKYFYKLDEAVNDVPEYVVPFEAFRALAEDYNLDLRYRRTFKEVWSEERTNREMGLMAERMRVTDRSGRLNLTRQEEDAAFFYQAFCFYKV